MTNEGLPHEVVLANDYWRLTTDPLWSLWLIVGDMLVVLNMLRAITTLPRAL
jgi:hypothetical protein